MSSLRSSWALRRSRCSPEVNDAQAIDVLRFAFQGVDAVVKRDNIRTGVQFLVGDGFEQRQAHSFLSRRRARVDVQNDQTRLFFEPFGQAGILGGYQQVAIAQIFLDQRPVEIGFRQKQHSVGRQVCHETTSCFEESNGLMWKHHERRFASSPVSNEFRGRTARTTIRNQPNFGTVATTEVIVTTEIGAGNCTKQLNGAFFHKNYQMNWKFARRPARTVLTTGPHSRIRRLGVDQNRLAAYFPTAVNRNPDPNARKMYESIPTRSKGSMREASVSLRTDLPSSLTTVTLGNR